MKANQRQSTRTRRYSASRGDDRIGLAELESATLQRLQLQGAIERAVPLTMSWL